MSGPFQIGAGTWPGLSKLTEECGELLQVVGKLIATGGDRVHWDGSDLRVRIEEEIADVLAACEFVINMCGLNRDAIELRTRGKLAIFQRWHAEQQGAHT